MKFFNRVFLLIFLIGGASIYCFTLPANRTEGWQAVAQASDMRINAEPQPMNPLPGWPDKTGFMYSNSEQKGDKAKSYYNRGTAYYKKENFDSAVKYLSMALVLEPKSADAYFNRGLSFRRQHKIDAAISDFTKAIQLHSNQPGYYFERCNALIVKNDFKGAVADCSDAIQLSPTEPEPYFLRGLAFMLKGDLEEALADSGKALQINPGYRDAKRLLFETLLKKETVNQKVSEN